MNQRSPKIAAVHIPWTTTDDPQPPQARVKCVGAPGIWYTRLIARGQCPSTVRIGAVGGRVWRPVPPRRLQSGIASYPTLLDRSQALGLPASTWPSGVLPSALVKGRLCPDRVGFLAILYITYAGGLETRIGMGGCFPQRFAVRYNPLLLYVEGALQVDLGPFGEVEVGSLLMHCMC